MKVLLGSLVILVAAAPSLMAQRAWQGGSGDWHDPANWAVGVPVEATAIEFPYLDEGAAMMVSINEAAVGRSVMVGAGVDLTLQLGSDVSLTTSSSWRIGYGDSGTGSGPAHVTVKGPASGIGSLNLTGGAANNQFFLNSGSVLTLKGANLRVEAAALSGVGTLAESHGNAIELQDGAIFKTTGFRLGQTTAGNGNSRENAIRVRSGSTLQVAGSVGVIGQNVGHYQNYLSVEGAGSKAEVDGQDIQIGNTAETNHGGNYIEVSDGGSLTTNAAIQIFGYNAAESAHGANRVMIGEGGTLTSSSSIEVGRTTSVSSSLLQLADGGVLDGSAEVTVNQNAIFEAAGNGLGAEVVISIKADGTLATGSAATTAPVVLSLKGATDFEEGGFLQMAVRAGGVDQIDFTAGATLSGDVTLLLDFDGAQAGEFYTLFTGDTSAVTAKFDLSHLDTQFWNTSQFNATGGWRVQAIPEPSSLAFLAVGAAFAGWMGRRGVGRKALPLLMSAGLLGGGVAGAAEVISVLDGEMEVERASEIRLPVVLTEVSPDHEAVLEFTAWHPAPKHAGFYAGMRVYLGSEELNDILDRPATFQTRRAAKEGKSAPIRRNKWWNVPVVPAPESYDPNDHTYVSPDQLNPFLFRFRLPVTQGGEYELRITNNIRHEQHPQEGYQMFPTMKVRDVMVRMEPKS